MSAGYNRFFALADDIRTLHKVIGRNADQMARYAIEAGRQYLIEAKSLLQHGAGEPWLRDHAATARLNRSAWRRRSSFASKDLRDKFSVAVIDAMRAAHPEIFKPVAV